MAYLGNAPARSFISFERQVFTIVNSQTAYTLSHSVTNENDIRLVVNNVVQEPGSGKAYTATGTALTLSAALTNGTDEMYCVFLGRATATNAPGAGSVGTSQLASDSVTLAKMASGTDGNIISYDASGNPVAVATGSDGQVLTSAGAGAPPVFETLPAGFTTLGASSVYLPGDLAISGDGYLTQSGAGAALTINNATASGTGIVTSTTSGHITLDKTGFYLIIYQMNANASSSRDEFNMYIRTWNGSSESNVGYSYLSPDNGSNPTVEGTCVAIVDVDNVSNIKFHMGYQGASNITLRGTGQSVTSMTFIRLGDT
jgi:hypothetical protein